MHYYKAGSTFRKGPGGDGFCGKLQPAKPEDFSMQRINFDHPHSLFDTTATRALEAAATAALPPHTLMQRAGSAVARLARALAPHARCIWVACGNGNNGGDGLEAAMLLHCAGYPVVVTWLGKTLPPDAQLSWQRARAAGVVFAREAPSLGPQDLAIDALLGLGLSSAPRANPPDARLLHHLQCLRACHATVLHVDLPSGLLADTGQWAEDLAPQKPLNARQRAHCHILALLTLKPGLFTGCGRDTADNIWLDDLDTTQYNPPSDGLRPWLQRPTAYLSGYNGTHCRTKHNAPHSSHKGHFGDVAIIGGEGLHARGQGMTGAAILAASAALHAGAGRVFLHLLDDGATTALPQQPEIMLRQFDTLDLQRLTVVCGCGGGQAVTRVLARVLEWAARLVLDADALNAIAADSHLQQLLRQRDAKQGRENTLLTPHPLEAARLLGTNTASIQADRLAAALALADSYQCTILLKGSGSVIADAGQLNIIPFGNALLASGGTGDVLAGLIGALMAQTAGPAAQYPLRAASAAGHACCLHGAIADAWPSEKPLTASALARAL